MSSTRASTGVSTASARWNRSACPLYVSEPNVADIGIRTRTKKTAAQRMQWTIRSEVRINGSSIHGARRHHRRTTDSVIVLTLGQPAIGNTVDFESACVSGVG
ncbi:hypothetical protein CH300_10255 [Rhodococcus sp. 15-1154-1]|nr:hypothetical protein CH300_10255 [Rhodococcus sp. 15-1154-1]